MSTQEQATLIGQELERKLSIFENYSVFYLNHTDGEDFYVDVVTMDGISCITGIAMNLILEIVQKLELHYFICTTNGGKPRVSIY